MMENGAYEDEANKSAHHLHHHQQYLHQHHPHLHQGPPQFLLPPSQHQHHQQLVPATMFDGYRNGPECHVYEDIAYSLESGVGGGFQRNLTLPLRRTSQSCESLEGGGGVGGGISSSVRVTSRERRASVIDRLSRESSLDNSCSSVERQGRRRRKKDCRHCKTKGGPTAEETMNHQQQHRDDLAVYEERNAELRAIFGLPNVGLCHLPPGCGLGPPVVYAIGCNSAECSNGLTPAGEPRFAHVDSAGDKGLVTSAQHPQRSRAGMKVNSIYAQEHWQTSAPASKDPRTIFLNEHVHPKDDSFQRAYSVVSANSPNADNRTNLRRSVRDESSGEHPARLTKHRHGWSLHFGRPLSALSASTVGCTKSLVLLLIVVLTLLGIGGTALYIVFEPQKLHVIQQYLRSGKNTTRFLTDNELGQDYDEESVSPTTILMSSTTTKFLELVPSMTFEGNSNDVPEDKPVYPTASSISPSSKGKLSTVLMTTTTRRPPSTTRSTTTLTSTSTTTTTTTTVRSTTMAYLETHPRHRRPCNECLSGEVCVARNADESAYCQTPKDISDPNGCAGICDYQNQSCHKEDNGAFRCVESEHHCLDDEWTCLNIFCIPLVKRCDGQMNCYDHSDEYNCECDLSTHFHCGNQTSCLPLSKKCDGHVDCFDASDEENCSTSHEFEACPSPNERTCGNKQQCFLKSRFCDGYKDCADGSDEPLGCQLGRCNKHEFSCRNSRCIDKTLKCNGIDDCGDGSDEKHCRERM